MPSLAIILPAGGSSTRFGANKLLATLDGKAILSRTIESLQSQPDVKQIIVVTNTKEVVDLAKQSDTRITIAAAGGTRADSVLSGLRAVDEAIEWVAIHDAARPLLTLELFQRTFAAAIEHGCAAPALPVSLTVKQASSPLPAKVERTVPRHQLFAMQTPQMMRRRDLLDAFNRCPIPLEDVTDDTQLMELAGYDVWLVPGDEANLKLTTPLDLAVAHAILQCK